MLDSGHGWTSRNGSNNKGLLENEFNTAIEDKVSLLAYKLGFEYKMLYEQLQVKMEESDYKILLQQLILRFFHQVSCKQEHLD